MRFCRDAVILAGGYGTRLAQAVPGISKPMVPVAGKPFLRFILDQMAAAKFERVVIADGYRREQIESTLGKKYRGMELVYSSEDTPLLTGGAAKKALRCCRGDWVFVLNGDTYLEVDFSSMELVAKKAAKNVLAVLAVKHMSNFDRYGTVDVLGDGTVAAFNEKTFCSEGLINAGAYLVRRNALRVMPDKFSLETDWFESVVRSGCLRTFECDGAFIDIGVPDDYERAQTLLSPLARKWKLAFFDRDGTINVDTGHLCSPEKLKLVPSVIPLLKYYTDDSDYKVIVVTNQAGIAKGFYTKAQMHDLHRAMDEKLQELDCRIDAYYYCPHHPEYTGPCECRKPKPGMLLAAMHDFDALPEECVMYGDKESDRMAAEAAGVKHYVMV